MMFGPSPPTLKKTPLLSAASQPKACNNSKTYVFELELAESNDKTYPEFSWADLVKDAKVKEVPVKNVKQGNNDFIIFVM